MYVYFIYIQRDTIIVFCFTNPTNNRRGLIIDLYVKPAVQSIFEINFCLNKKKLIDKNS